MNTLKGATILILICAITAGCAVIPKNGALLSGRVSDGIRRLQAENEKVIGALADVERAILDENWETLYANVERQYMKENSIPDPSRLSQDDRRRISATAAQTRKEILDEVKEKEMDLIRKSRANSEMVITLNEEVRRYLLSLESLKHVRQQTTSLLSQITGIDLTSLHGTVKARLSSF
jgi:hypothetical protein